MYFTLKFSEYVPACLVMKAVIIKLKNKLIYRKQNLQKKPKKSYAEGQRSKLCGKKNRD